MAKETDELEAAKARIVTLEAELEVARTPKQVDKKEEQLTDALKRLETLEGKYGKPKEEKEEEEEDGDQCPVCGHVLSDMGSGEWYCSGCEEYFEEEED